MLDTYPISTKTIYSHCLSYIYILYMNLFLVELITIILLTSPHHVYHIFFYILVVDRWFIDASHPLPCTSRCPRKVSRYSTALRPASKATLLSKSGLVKIEMARSKWRHSCWIYIRIYSRFIVDLS